MEFKGDYARTRASDSKTSPNSDFGLFLPGLDTYIISVHPFHSEHLLNLEVKGVALMRYQVIICLNVKLELALLATHKCLNLLHDDLSH